MDWSIRHNLLYFVDWFSKSFLEIKRLKIIKDFVITKKILYFFIGCPRLLHYPLLIFRNLQQQQQQQKNKRTNVATDQLEKFLAIFKTALERNTHIRKSYIQANQASFKNKTL